MFYFGGDIKKSICIYYISYVYNMIYLSTSKYARHAVCSFQIIVYSIEILMRLKSMHFDTI